MVDITGINVVEDDYSSVHDKLDEAEELRKEKFRKSVVVMNKRRETRKNTQIEKRKQSSLQTITDTDEYDEQDIDEFGDDFI